MNKFLLLLIIAIVLALSVKFAMAEFVELEAYVDVDWTSSKEALIEVTGGDRLGISCDVVNATNYNDFDEQLKAEVPYSNQLYVERIDIDWRNEKEFKIIPPEGGGFGYSCDLFNESNFNDQDARWDFEFDVFLPEIDGAIEKILNLTEENVRLRAEIEILQGQVSQESCSSLENDLASCRDDYASLQGDVDICMDEKDVCETSLEGGVLENNENYTAIVSENKRLSRSVTVLENDNEALEVELKGEVKSGDTKMFIAAVVAWIITFLFMRRSDRVMSEEAEAGFGDDFRLR